MSSVQNGSNAPVELYNSEATAQQGIGGGNVGDHIAAHDSGGISRANSYFAYAGDEMAEASNQGDLCDRLSPMQGGASRANHSAARPAPAGSGSAASAAVGPKASRQERLDKAVALEKERDRLTKDGTLHDTSTCDTMINLLRSKEPISKDELETFAGLTRQIKYFETVKPVPSGEGRPAAGQGGERPRNAAGSHAASGAGGGSRNHAASGPDGQHGDFAAAPLNNESALNHCIATLKDAFGLKDKQAEDFLLDAEVRNYDRPAALLDELREIDDSPKIRPSWPRVSTKLKELLAARADTRAALYAKGCSHDVITSAMWNANTTGLDRLKKFADSPHCQSFVAKHAKDSLGDRATFARKELMSLCDGNEKRMKRHVEAIHVEHPVIDLKEKETTPWRNVFEKLAANPTRYRELKEELTSRVAGEKRLKQHFSQQQTDRLQRGQHANEAADPAVQTRPRAGQVTPAKPASHPMRSIGNIVSNLEPIVEESDDVEQDLFDENDNENGIELQLLENNDNRDAIDDDVAQTELNVDNMELDDDDSVTIDMQNEINTATPQGDENAVAGNDLGANGQN